jgi:hypothetical protein
VLKNLQTYLQEEDTRMQQADRDCKWKYIFKFHSAATVRMFCDTCFDPVSKVLYLLDEGTQVGSINLRSIASILFSFFFLSIC